MLVDKLKIIIMKSYKTFLLVIYIAIETLAILLFIFEEINSTTFFLLSLSMTLMVGLYFYDKNKVEKNNV